MEFDPSLPDDRVNVSQTSVVREALTLVVGAAAVIALAVALLTLLIERVIVWVPPEIESSLLGSLWDDVETVDDSPHAARLQTLFDAIVAEHPKYAEGYRIAVVESDMPNAFALPGGMILFTSALLDEVDNENEVAFVIGHELGHFENRDHLRGIGRGLAFALVASAVGLGGDAVGEVAQFTAALTSRSFSRRQELAADRFGVEVLARHYGHGGGARSLIEDVLAEPNPPAADQNEEERKGDESFTRFLDTHPPFPERVEAIERELSERGVAATGALEPWISLGDETEAESASR